MGGGCGLEEVGVWEVRRYTGRCVEEHGCHRCVDDWRALDTVFESCERGVDPASIRRREES